MTRVVLYHPDAHWSALARVYLEMGRALSTRGVTVAMACPAVSDVASAAMPLEILPVSPRGSWWADGTRLGQLLRDYGADAVVAADDEAQLVAAWAVRRAGRGVVIRRMREGVTVPETVSARLAVRLAPTWFMHSAEADAAVDMPVPRLRGRFAANIAIDPSAFDRVVAAPTPIGTITITLVTDPVSTRATAAALRAIAALRARGHPLRALLIGHPHDVNEVRVHATALGLGDSVTLLGDPVDRAPLLAASDLVWVTANHDDGSLATLDAMALGRPVLVTRGTTPERFVRNGQTGIVLDPDDAFASAASVTHLLGDSPYLDRLGEAARQEVRSNGAQTLLADRIVSAVKKAVSSQAAA